MILISLLKGARTLYRRPVQPRGIPREMATAWGRLPAILKLLVKIIATSFRTVIKVLVKGFSAVKLEPTSCVDISFLLVSVSVSRATSSILVTYR